MKRLALVLLFLVAAAPAMGALDVLPPPVVVVYPFTINGSSVDPEVGGRLAVIYATQLANEGGVTVKPATPGTDRPHFLEEARKVGADYYVTGYLTPLGDEVSLVDQVVSTYSGTVVYSASTQIRTYQEAIGQVDIIRTAIIHHAGRTLAALDAPPPLPKSTPTAAAAGNLNNIFGRHPKATPAPHASGASASPTATATRAAAANARATRAPAPPSPPPPGARPSPSPSAAPSVAAVAVARPVATSAAIVVVMGGDAIPKDRTYASNAVSSAIAKAGYGGALIATTMNSDVPARAQQLCTQNSAGAIYGGTLSLKHSLFGRADANFELVRYNCAGAVTARHRATSNASGSAGSATAIDHAVAESVNALLASTKGS